jgi:hypothetical protein
MSKIFIRGVGEIAVDRSRAKQLFEDWYQQKLGTAPIKIGEVIFNPKDLKAVNLEDGDDIKKRELDEYNLFDPAQKQIVVDFDEEFTQWKRNHPEITEWHQFHYMQEQGAIIMGEVRPMDIVHNLVKYNQLQKLFSSRGTMLYYREKARAGNDPDFASKRRKMFEDMKRDLMGKVSMKTSVTAQPKADPIAQEAKKFDEQYGIDEYKDIDPKLIPF